jgi:FixJ family two-component response regulator
MSIKEHTIVPQHVVAVVEDDAAVRSSLRFVLEIEGYAVRLFSEPLDLLSASALPACECLILDYKLPNMTGLGLLGELRRRGVDAPAVLITSHPTSQLQEQAKQAGVALVEKPFLDNVLIDEVRKAIAHVAQPNQNRRA